MLLKALIAKKIFESVAHYAAKKEVRVLAGSFLTLLASKAVRKLSYKYPSLRNSRLAQNA